MRIFMSVKMIKAEPERREGKDGYRIEYPDGYTSWCPKEEFEKFNFPCSIDPDYCVRTYKFHQNYIKSLWVPMEAVPNE